MLRTKLERRAARVLRVPVSTLNMGETCDLVASWAEDGDRTRCVTFANAHMLAVASTDDTFLDAMNEMDLNCPDGRPLVWVARHLEGHPEARNVAGPDFLPYFIKHTRGKGLRHFFLGAASGVAEMAVGHLRKFDADLQIAGIYSPPFGPLTDEALAMQANMINKSGANIVWVSLGCPKQERWLQRNRHRIDRKVVLAVGQAFDVTSGNVRRAPKVLRVVGLEWFYRLLRNPVRLSPRYLVYNSIFLWNVLIVHVLKARDHSQ
jgi:N-acetylglucosaminyldiphosphoundecaprenol N-acetyl-beta-D-mannosaminyltransferase